MTSARTPVLRTLIVCVASSYLGSCWCLAENGLASGNLNNSPPVSAISEEIDMKKNVFVNMYIYIYND
jgi:hypothetical protein